MTAEVILWRHDPTLSIDITNTITHGKVSVTQLYLVLRDHTAPPRLFLDFPTPGRSCNSLLRKTSLLSSARLNMNEEKTRKPWREWRGWLKLSMRMRARCFRRLHGNAWQSDSTTHLEVVSRLKSLRLILDKACSGEKNRKNKNENKKTLQPAILQNKWLTCCSDAGSRCKWTRNFRAKMCGATAQKRNITANNSFHCLQIFYGLPLHLLSISTHPLSRLVSLSLCFNCL